MFRDNRVRAQSAMEYLMTYGWAILIIAVVLGVLFQLGIFSGSALVPKAQPGSCQVFRTSAATSLEGECQGELPQYVAQFNGNGAYAQIPDSTPIDSADSFTASFWIRFTTPYSGGCCWSVINKGWVTTPRQWYFIVNRNGGGSIDFGANTIGTLAELDYSWNDYNWHLVTGTLSGNIMTLYIDGVQKQQDTNMIGALAINNQPIWIASQLGGVGTYFPGYIANFQFYNTSLSQAEITALYLEGIGGAPVKVQNIVGWWPLNGNANDYSGNNNNGAATGVTYSNSWGSGYTPP